MRRAAGGPTAGKGIAMATSTDPSPGSYMITGGEQGKRRLNLLAEIMQPTTLRLLAEAGLRGGDRYLDLGCGGGHVVLDMARIVGPDGLGHRGRLRSADRSSWPARTPKTPVPGTSSITSPTR